jgi:NADPH:quinone reductase-like Zn-dependent oxidoreductase
MKAAVLERRGPEGVSWREFSDPAPAPRESVLRVAASSLNRVDLYMRDNGAGIHPCIAAGDGRRSRG